MNAPSPRPTDVLDALLASGTRLIEALLDRDVDAAREAVLARETLVQQVGGITQPGPDAKDWHDRVAMLFDQQRLIEQAMAGCEAHFRKALQNVAPLRQAHNAYQQQPQTRILNHRLAG